MISGDKKKGMVLSTEPNMDTGSCLLQVEIKIIYQPVLQGKPALLLLKGAYHGQQNLLVQNELLEYLQLLSGFGWLHSVWKLER